MITKKFQRHKEDFTCEHCGVKVSGTGYTNHCPECFYSKHVDINPGDRQADCENLMKPIRVELDHGKQMIVHQCLRCGFERRNKISPNDNLPNLRNIIKNFAKE